MNGSRLGYPCILLTPEIIRQTMITTRAHSDTSPTVATLVMCGKALQSLTISSRNGLAQNVALFGEFDQGGLRTLSSNARLESSDCGRCGRNMASCTCDFGV